MKTRFILITILALCSTSAFADNSSYRLLGTGFFAPSVVGKSNVYSPEVGAIIYDETDSTFYGYNHSGSWTVLSTASANVSSASTGQERIERISISGGSVPSISSQSGAWVSSLTRNSAGSVTLNIASGEFSSAPTCTCNAVGTSVGYAGCNITPAPTSTAVTVLTQTTGGSGVDLNVAVICMGPH